MKKHFFIFCSVISLIIIFTILSCKQNTESGESGSSYPILKISSSYDGYIYRVGLAGYSFDDLRIGNNEDKVFELKNEYLNNETKEGFSTMDVYLKKTGFNSKYCSSC